MKWWWIVPQDANFLEDVQKQWTLRKMNEVDRTGERLTSLLYVHVFFWFLLIYLKKKKFEFISPVPPSKINSTELKLNAGVLAFMNWNSRVGSGNFESFQIPHPQCVLHTPSYWTHSHFCTPSRENIGCESHVCLFKLLYTYMIYI